MISQEDFTDEERYKMNVKMAVSLIKHLHKEGKITDKAMEKIEKDAKKRLLFTVFYSKKRSLAMRLLSHFI